MQPAERIPIFILTVTKKAAGPDPDESDVQPLVVGLSHGMLIRC
jgi:hypothetical protein